MQYYDNIGILGAIKNAKGHRTYTEVHLRKLTRINYYKSLGLSLEQIKNKLSDSDSDNAVEKELCSQSIMLRRQMEGIKAKLHGIEVSQKLRAAGYEIPWKLLAGLMNVLEMDAIDHWSEYEFPEEDYAVFQEVFLTEDAVFEFYNEFRRLILYSAAYEASEVPMESELVEVLYKDWQAMVTNVTSGNAKAMEALLRVDSDRAQWSRGEQDLISKGEPYLTKVILHYDQAREE